MENKIFESKLKLCKAYYSIIKSSLNTEIYIEELSIKSKDSIKQAQIILPKLQKDYKIFFLTTLLFQLDRETLNEFEEEISYDNISNVYEKILEGITLRFEKYLPYISALKILSNSLELTANNFLELLETNYSFMSDLLDLVEKNPNQFKKFLKSIGLNLVFIKTIDNFLKEENTNLDSTIRYLDKHLREFEDIGQMIGINNK